MVEDEPVQPGSAKPWWKRGWGIAVIVIGILALGGAIVELTETDETGELPASAPETPAEDPTPAAAFHPETVLVELPLQAPGFTRVEVHFVTGGDVAAAAEGCVTHFLASYESVFCYGFVSREDFDAAGVNEDAGGMERLCWTARAEKANPDAEVRTDDRGPIDRECPSVTD